MKKLLYIPTSYLKTTPSVHPPHPTPPHQSGLWEPSQQFVNLYPVTSAHPRITLSHISAASECLPINVLLQSRGISVALSRVTAT